PRWPQPDRATRAQHDLGSPSERGRLDRRHPPRAGPARRHAGRIRAARVESRVSPAVWRRPAARGDARELAHGADRRIAVNEPIARRLVLPKAAQDLVGAALARHTVELQGHEVALDNLHDPLDPVLETEFLDGLDLVRD